MRRSYKVADDRTSPEKILWNEKQGKWLKPLDLVSCNAMAFVTAETGAFKRTRCPYPNLPANLNQDGCLNYYEYNPILFGIGFVLPVAALNDKTRVE
jgi:hypothetical protein